MMKIKLTPKRGYTVYDFRLDNPKEIDVDTMTAFMSQVSEATRSRTRSIRQLLLEINRSDLRGVYEIKSLSLTVFPNWKITIRSETGLNGDEETLAGIFGRTNRHVMIGKSGGLEAQKELAGDAMVSGNRALITTF